MSVLIVELSFVYFGSWERRFSTEILIQDISKEIFTQTTAVLQKAIFNIY